MHTSNKPTTVKAEGVAIHTDIMDEADGTVKHTLVIYNDQFYKFLKQFQDHRGVTKLEVVKRKFPSAKGHDHFIRVASNLTNKCVVNDGVVPVKSEYGGSSR